MPRRKRRTAVFAARWIALVLVVVIVVVAGYTVYNYQRFVSGITHVDALVPTTADIDGDDQNILLVGDDHRPADATPEQLAQIGTELDGGGTSTDTMMVMHIPADGSQATLVSFPRDSWVSVPGFGKNKLNAAYALGSATGGDSGGAKLLVTVIQAVTGLTIDHYVRVSMLGFYSVVDALGPVSVCLVNAVDDPYSTLNLPAGVSTLNAQQALAFVRQRHGLTNGDLDRQVRQQYFLSVEARKILSPGTLLNPWKLQSVLDAVSSAVETDPGFNFLDLGMRLQKLGADKIASATIPIAGTPTISVGGTAVSIVDIDTAAMPEFISGIVGVPSAYAAATAASPSEVTVTVLNGSTTNGAAAATTKTLAALGFATGTPASTTARSTSTIEYPPGEEAAAKAVASALPAATVTPSAAVDGVTVVIGANGLQAVSPATVPDTPASAVPATEAPAQSTATTTYAEGACIN